MILFNSYRQNYKQINTKFNQIWKKSPTLPITKPVFKSVIGNSKKHLYK